jgi:type IV pilus assembly protein PilB
MKRYKYENTFESLNRKNIDELGFDSAFFLSFPADIRNAYKVFPVKRESGRYHIICADGENADMAVEARNNHLMLLAMQSGERFETEKAEIVYYLAKADYILALDKQVSSSAEAEERIVGEGRAEKTFTEIMDGAIRLRASDVHIVPLSASGGMHVRFRIDGIMEDYLRDGNMNMEEYIQFVNYVMNAGKMDMTRKRLPQDGIMSYSWNRTAYELRIATMPLEMFAQRDDLNKVQFRILYQDSRIMLSDLGMLENELNIVDSMMRQPSGIIICTGPTSSGKSTTMYALLHGLDMESQVCYTVENPVEYKLEGANQISVNEASGRTFQSILRSLMRLDTDIVYVGEVRDSESALMACQIANTGHTVFTTLHTNNAYSAPLRLISMDIPEYLVTSNIKGVIAQRLVKKNCPHCLEEYRPDEYILSMLNLPSGASYMKSRGCEKCGNKGYIGRTALFELLPTYAMDGWIRLAREPELLHQEAKKMYFPDLYDSYKARIERNITCPEYVAEVMMRM